VIGLGLAKPAKIQPHWESLGDCPIKFAVADDIHFFLFQKIILLNSDWNNQGKFLRPEIF
jgi:hypothetical protein